MPKSIDYTVKLYRAHKEGSFMSDMQGDNVRNGAQVSSSNKFNPFFPA